MIDSFSFLQDKKVIVFDLDGTIVNLSADWPALKKILKTRYKELYNESCSSNTISGCLSEIVAKKDEDQLLKFFDLIRTYEMKNIQKTTPIEESVFFIKHKEQFGVKRDTKLAILSLNTRTTINKSLELAEIRPNFEIVIGREDVRAWKPEPEGLFKIKTHFNANEEDIVFFGDLENDIKTGKNAGIDAYYIHELIDYVNRFITKKKEK